MSNKFYLLALVFLITTSCATTSLEDYREEAQGISRSIIKEIQAIHTKEELAQHSAHLKRLFEKLVDVMIAAHEFKLKHQVDQPPLSNDDKLLSENLLIELTRLYKIEGARDVIEKLQEDSLFRLDAFLKKNNLNTL